jgi:hypothetical protein
MAAFVLAMKRGDVQNKQASSCRQLTLHIGTMLSVTEINYP